LTPMTILRTSILCVDDDSRVLEGLKLTLSKSFDVATATSGVEGLAVLKQKLGTAVVIADMRMPTMDGATFLAKVRSHWPDSTRLLLTGDPGRDTAVAAVNEGQIFRFLTKPCAPDKLIAAVEAAVRQYQLVTAEKALLQQTVLGSIRALVDILAIVNPIAFGRGSRIQRLALDLAAAAGVPPSWELEAAALLSQLGYVSLPIELVEKAVNGEALNAAEALLLGEAPRLTQSLIARIPRLENVGAILGHANRAYAGKDRIAADVAASAVILMNVLEFDALTSKGESAEAAIGTLMARGGAKSAPLLAHLAALQGMADSGPPLREIRLCEVLPGMILLDDVRTDLGTLLVSRGYEISHSFVDRMRNFGPGLLQERVRVKVRTPIANIRDSTHIVDSGGS
jgi:CheY-like chemotaxis protein